MDFLKGLPKADSVTAPASGALRALGIGPLGQLFADVLLALITPGGSTYYPKANTSYPTQDTINVATGAGTSILAANDANATIIIQNIDADNYVDIGFAGSGSAADGIRLYAKSGIALSGADCPVGEIYGIANTATCDVRIAVSVYT